MTKEEKVALRAAINACMSAYTLDAWGSDNRSRQAVSVAEARLGALVDAPMFADGSGYDFSK